MNYRPCGRYFFIFFFVGQLLIVAIIVNRMGKFFKHYHYYYYYRIENKNTIDRYHESMTWCFDEITHTHTHIANQINWSIDLQYTHRHTHNRKFWLIIYFIELNRYTSSILQNVELNEQIITTEDDGYKTRILGKK